jgi:hypothetical protein
MYSGRKISYLVILLVGITIFPDNLLALERKSVGDSLNKAIKSIPSRQAGNMTFSLTPALLVNTPMKLQFAGGLYYQLFLSENFSVDADLLIGREYVHLGPGTIVVPIWAIIISNFHNYTYDPFFIHDGFNIKSFLAVLVLTALAFEHVSLHFPVSETTEISPYISLLRFKYASTPATSSDTTIVHDQICGATGIHFNKYYGHFFISPFIEYNIGYTDLKSGVNVGINCGFRF